MKLIAALLLFSGLLVGADREGNFKIRFEPTAKLQTGVEVPFEIHVNDSRDKPLLRDTEVQLEIARPGGQPTGSVKAWYVQPGVYIAKPQFPADGQWAVTVDARRNNATTKRIITFIVTD